MIEAYYKYSVENGRCLEACRIRKQKRVGCASCVFCAYFIDRNIKEHLILCDQYKGMNRNGANNN